MAAAKRISVTAILVCVITALWGVVYWQIQGNEDGIEENRKSIVLIYEKISDLENGQITKAEFKEIVADGLKAFKLDCIEEGSMFVPGAQPQRKPESRP